jgi:hypothetical protein
MNKIPKNIRFRRLIGVVPLLAWAFSLFVENKSLKGVIYLLGVVIFIIGLAYSSRKK